MTDLPPDVRSAAFDAAFQAYDDNQPHSSGILAVVDAVTAVVAEEIERPLQARIAELEAALSEWKQKSLTREEWAAAARTVFDTDARVELLTAALTDCKVDLNYIRRRFGMSYARSLIGARAALAAGVTESEAP